MKVNDQTIGLAIVVGLGLLLFAMISRRGAVEQELPRLRLQTQGARPHQYINEEEIDLKWGPDYMLQKIVIHRHATEA